MDKFILYNDDCLNALKLMEDNSIDSCVTDPPYGLSFMGKAWDYDVPKTDIWKEVFRVLKPGAHLLAFFGSRTYHRGVVPIEDAGFEIRDQIMWLYGSGFPKSHNIGDGWGTALKPAHEPIVVARKPITQTVVNNVSEYGTGAINIDECRTEEKGMKWEKPRGGIWQTDKDAKAELVKNELGRWPANVIHDGSDDVVASFPNETSKFFYSAKASKSDKDEGLENFLAKKTVSFQTGNGASGKPSSLSAGRETEYKNIHPTVKPTDLMKYLCRLVTPKKGIVLDPFMGSGSTGKAAAQEGFKFIGIEMSEEYFEIAEARIKNAYDGITVSLEDFFS